MSDLYTDGFCKRCDRKREDCQKIIDSGKRCTEKPANDPCGLKDALNGFPDVNTQRAYYEGQ